MGLLSRARAIVEEHESILAGHAVAHHVAGAAVLNLGRTGWSRSGIGILALSVHHSEPIVASQTLCVIIF